MADNGNNQANQQLDPPGPCPIVPTPLSGFTSAPTTPFVEPAVTHTVKVPVVLGEPTIQIHLEATIPTPGATEIKRVKKNVFLDQVKLVPVAPFTRIDGTDFFAFARAKVFIAGHIRKNIEFATAACTGALQDTIADIPFSGVTELSIAAGTLLSAPKLGINEFAESSFLSDTNQLNARLDKFFFQNLVKFNEQPFGELVAANFFELDFATPEPSPEGVFNAVTEKLVLELTVKVLQMQQLQFTSAQVVPVLPGLTPPA